MSFLTQKDSKLTMFGDHHMCPLLATSTQGPLRMTQLAQVPKLQLHFLAFANFVWSAPSKCTARANIKHQRPPLS